MNIVRCDDSFGTDWNAYVSATPHASFYHRFEWREINQACLGHESCYLAALSQNKIVGVFPLVHVSSRLFGNIACSLPFVNYGGPIGEDDGVDDLLIAEAGRVADQWGVDFLEIRSRRHLGPQFPTSQHKVSMTVDLSPDPDLLWKGFKTEHRQHIRRGYKNGFTAKLGHVELLDDFFKVLSEAWRDMGTPIYAKSYLETVAKAFPGAARLCVVYGGGKPVAASFQAYDGGVAEGLWLGSLAKYRHDYAGYVLYWELLKDAAMHGCTQFHLGRSTVDSGGDVFKRKWNAHPTQLYWQYVLRGRNDIPQINVNNPRYRLAIGAWRHLPVAVTTRVGPILARCIP
jgi:FemAB-related protein (PEP-CTERM system-associated)